jgi:hypothetical protein
MSYAVTNPGPIPFKPYVTVSGILHAALLIFLALASYFHWQGNQWS